VCSGPSIPFYHTSNYKEKSPEPVEPVNPPRFIVPETKKRHVWLCDTLQDVKRHASPRGTFRKSR
jgi:hypothetical protein